MIYSRHDGENGMTVKRLQWMMIFFLLFSSFMTAETNITTASSIDQLPDDTATLKQMVLTLLGQIDNLEGQLHYLKRQLFGKKSEKIDNNLSERTLRMVVISRRNYLFAGSEAGAERAAIIYSLVASCKLNDHDPVCAL